MGEDISKRLAKRLYDARKDRALSLEALAKLSGVSRSMLSAIERSESSPTVAILWNLTRALNIDFAGLLDSTAEPDGAIIEVIRAAQAPIIHSIGEGCRIKILSAPENVGETEIYEVEFQKGGFLDSDPHRRGCLENLTVISGAITVKSDEATETVYEGDIIRYYADRRHILSSPHNASRAILIVSGS